VHNSGYDNDQDSRSRQMHLDPEHAIAVVSFPLD
jgi:hypothetical protein